jgi:hypothetical protein
MSRADAVQWSDLKGVPRNDGNGAFHTTKRVKLIGRDAAGVLRLDFLVAWSVAIFFAELLWWRRNC